MRGDPDEVYDPFHAMRRNGRNSASIRIVIGRAADVAGRKDTPPPVEPEPQPGTPPKKPAKNKLPVNGAYPFAR